MNEYKNPIENMAQAFQKLCNENLVHSQHYKNSEKFAEKVADVSLSLAQQSVELSNQWSKEIISQVEKASSSEVKDPDQYAKVLNDLVTEATQVSVNKLANYADMIQDFQKETTQAYLDLVRTDSPESESKAGQQSDGQDSSPAQHSEVQEATSEPTSMPKSSAKSSAAAKSPKRQASKAKS